MKNCKTKNAYFLIGLLMFSLFAGVFVMADEDSSTGDSAVEVSDIEVSGVETSDVEEIIKDVETLEGHKKVGFVVVRKGNGWIENGEEGMLINGFWASQKFAEVDTENAEVGSVEIVRARGRLHIAGAGNYLLVRVSEEVTTEEVESVSFYLVKPEKYTDREEAIENSVGILSLTKENQYGKLTVWKGELSLNEGKAQGTWNVELATDVKRVKPEVVKNRISFWKKARFWRAQENPNLGNSEDRRAQIDFEDSELSESNERARKARKINKQRIKFAN